MGLTLSELPSDHPLRNTPLGQIQAECRNIHQKRWTPVREWKHIKNATYNQLGASWIELYEWRVNEIEE